MGCFQVGLQRFEAAPSFNQGNHIIADLTLNGQAFFKYQIGQSGRYGLLLGYRYMNLEIKERVEGVDIETDLTYSGPVFGFMFKW